MSFSYAQSTANNPHRALQPAIMMSLVRELTSLCKELDDTRPPDLDLPTIADGFNDVMRIAMAAKPGSAQSLAFISRASPKRIALIFSKWDRLRAMFGQYKGTINNRWRKSSVVKRKGILVEAWGQDSKIPPNRRPNFDAYKRGLKGNEHKWTYLLPMINLEDLIDKTNLMLFIESRASYEPNVFAWSDTSTVRMAVENGVKIHEVSGSNMMLTGEPRGTYGKILSWVQDDAFRSISGNLTAMYEGRGFNVGEGFVCLEIQGKILTFLVKVCELLLADIDMSTVTDIPTDILPATSFLNQDLLKDLSPSAGSYSLMEVRSKARYQVPKQLDLVYLRRLAIAKRDEAFDEICALREDPSFFQEALASSYEFHRDCSIAIMSIVRPGQKRLALEDREAFRAACMHIVARSYAIAITWSTILEDLDLLVKLQIKYGSNISPTKSLPAEYNEALNTLCLSIMSWMPTIVIDIGLRTAFNRALGQYYQFEIGNTEHGYTTAGLTAKPKKYGNMQVPPIVVLLNDLQDMQNQNIFGIPALVDEIEHMMHLDKSHTSQGELIDAPMANLLSELAAFAEIDYQTQQHQPKIILPADHEGCTKKWENRLQIRDTIPAILVKGTGFVPLCDPLSGFDYPSHKKRTEQNVNQLRAAEAKLDEYWEHVDQLFLLHTGKTLKRLVEKIIGHREIKRTAPWQPPAIQPKPAKSINDDSIARQLLEMKLTQQVKDTVTVPSLPKQKLKTRGEADPSKEIQHVDTTEMSPSDDSAATPTRTFVVPKKAYKVIMALFPTDDNRIPGKIRWGDFVDAMSKLGFSSRQTAGSSFHFQPSWEEDSPITFHRPHPSDEIPFAKLRFHASRLARRYGWTSASFVME